MTEDDYNKALDSILTELGIEANCTSGSTKDKPVVDPLSLIRMMAKYDSNVHRKVVRSVVFGLILARLPVTDENIRWLIRDNQLGYERENEMFQKGSSGKVPLFSSGKTDIEGRYQRVMREMNGS